LDGRMQTAALQAAAYDLNRDTARTKGSLGLFAEDVGWVDFCKLGFLLFGYRMEALYFTYFLVTGVGLVCFMVEFRRCTPAMIVVVAIQATMLFIINAMPYMVPESVEANLQLGSVINGRFMATIGLVPFFHLLFASALTLPPTRI